MPFGLVNAPLYFQRAMNNIVGNRKFIKVYLDDLLIFSKTQEQHEKDIITTINLLHKNNISINFKKSKFYQTSVVFLGNIISAQGISPDYSKIQDLEKHVHIKSRKDLQSLLGFINWFRPYLCNLSTKLISITDKLKDAKFNWSNEDNLIVNSILAVIKEGVLLSFPNYNYPFELYSDASDVGIGSILKQGDSIIGYYSKKLKGSELNYTVMEKEVYAILKSIDHFRTIISHAYVKIFTDNSNSIFSLNTPTKRIYRWKRFLNEYNFSLEFVSGCKNEAADYLSRIYKLSNSEVFNYQLLHDWQLSDQKIKEMKDLKTHVLDDGTELFSDDKDRIILPGSRFNEFFAKFHELLGHPGYRKFYCTFKPYYIISNFLRKVKNLTKQCIFCQKNKLQIQSSPVSTTKFHADNYLDIVCTDIIGPFNTGERFFKYDGKFYFITYVDIFSRGLQIYFLDDISSSKVASTFREFINQVGPPKRLQSDNGRQYISNEFACVFHEFGINHTFSPRNTPQANGVSERLNSNIKTIMRILTLILLLTGYIIIIIILPIVL